ncbi:MAG: Nif3-like dinuclear metal center hexameric protein [Oscillospiraceae bacterium]|nr:Nif3-like dinuclear metal center hexameric protein [Oscillospiraceae bacterium]
MTTVHDILCLMDEKAPFSMQESWDNSGLLVGRRSAEVNSVFLTLDITPETIQEAIDAGANLIVSHHPVIFGKIASAVEDDYTGKRVLMLAEHRIAAICCHTCLDSVPGGVNDVLAEKCGIVGSTSILEQSGVHPAYGPYGVGRVGELAAPMDLTDYLTLLKQSLAPNGLRYWNANRLVKRVAVGGGSCGSMMEAVLAHGCDTFVTSDVKYDQFLCAKDAGLNLIDAGHYPTENPVMERVESWLRAAFPELKVTKSALHREVISYR